VREGESDRGLGRGREGERYELGIEIDGGLIERGGLGRKGKWVRARRREIGLVKERGRKSGGWERGRDTRGLRKGNERETISNAIHNKTLNY